jgi:D-3-phosphoglycerate dehydrogenase
MRWRVLVSAPHLLPVLDEYEDFFRDHDIDVIAPPVNERMSESELLQWIGDIDGLVCGDDQLTERVLRSAPKLRVISKWGTGVDSIDHEAAARLQISVHRTPNAFTDPVADTVLGYVLCFARQLPQMNDELRRGVWQKRSAQALHECTLGVVGIGDIGKAVARRAAPFGMRVLGNDIVEIPRNVIDETRLETAVLDDLLTQSDFVSLNCDLNPTSFHIIGERELELMKPTAYLINTARGPLIDEPALARALQEGWLAGAALDVFEDEPLPKDSPLRQIDEVMLAPHNANSSPSAWQRIHQQTLANLVQGLRDAETNAIPGESSPSEH